MFSELQVALTSSSCQRCRSQIWWCSATLYSGSAAKPAGGLTSLIEEARTPPPTTDRCCLQSQKVYLAIDQLLCDLGRTCCAVKRQDRQCMLTTMARFDPCLNMQLCCARSDLYGCKPHPRPEQSATQESPSDPDLVLQYGSKYAF